LWKGHAVILLEAKTQAIPRLSGEKGNRWLENARCDQWRHAQDRVGFMDGQIATLV
jgi:hypothetical protein